MEFKHGDYALCIDNSAMLVGGYRNFTKGKVYRVVLPASSAVIEVMGNFGESFWYKSKFDNLGPILSPLEYAIYGIS